MATNVPISREWCPKGTDVVGVSFGIIAKIRVQMKQGNRENRNGFNQS